MKAKFFVPILLALLLMMALGTSYAAETVLFSDDFNNAVAGTALDGRTLNNGLGGTASAVWNTAGTSTTCRVNPLSGSMEGVTDPHWALVRNPGLTMGKTYRFDITASTGSGAGSGSWFTAGVEVTTDDARGDWRPGINVFCQNAFSNCALDYWQADGGAGTRKDFAVFGGGNGFNVDANGRLPVQILYVAQDRSVEPNNVDATIFFNGYKKAEIHVTDGAKIDDAFGGTTGGHGVGIAGMTGSVSFDNVKLTQDSTGPAPIPTVTPGNGYLVSDTFENGVVGDSINGRTMDNGLGGSITGKWAVVGGTGKIAVDPNLSTNKVEDGSYNLVAAFPVGMIPGTWYRAEYKFVAMNSWGVATYESDGADIWGNFGIIAGVQAGSYVLQYPIHDQPYGGGYNYFSYANAIPNYSFTAADKDANGEVSTCLMYIHQDRKTTSTLDAKLFINGHLKGSCSGLTMGAGGGEIIGFAGAAASSFMIDNFSIFQGNVDPPTPTPSPTPTPTPTPWPGNVVLFSDTFETGNIGDTLDKATLGNQLGGVMTNAKWISTAKTATTYISNPFVSGNAAFAVGYSTANAEFFANPANGYALEATIGAGPADQFSNLFMYHDPGQAGLWTDVGLMCRFVTAATGPYLDVLYRNTRNANVAAPAIRGSVLLLAADYDANGSVPVKWYISYMDVTTTSTVSGTVYANGNKKFDFITGAVAATQVSPAGRGAGFMNVYGTGYIDDFKLSQVTPTPVPTASPTPYPPQAGKAPILFVTGLNPPSITDWEALMEMTRLGYPVNVKAASEIPDEAAAVALAAKNGLVVVSESISSGAIAAKFINVTTPVMSYEPGIFDDMKMTSATDLGASGGTTTLEIAAAGDPMAAGLTGTVSIYNALVAASWGIPGTGAVIVAKQTGDATHATIFYYETGAQMVGMTAPARRIGFFMREVSPDFMTADAWKLFDAAITGSVVATPTPTPPPTPTPEPTPVPEVTPVADIVFVDGAKATTGDGASWATAFKTIQEGLATSNTRTSTSPLHIWVKKGTYATGNIHVYGNQSIYGGFAGTENPALFRMSQRDFAKNATIIDAAGKGHGVVIAIGANGGIQNAALDGLTIKNADAVANKTDVPQIIGCPESVPGGTFSDRGGGIMAYGSAINGAPRTAEVIPPGSFVPVVRLRYVKVDNCKGSVGGGGQLDRMVFLVDNCEFTNNKCTVSGAGVVDTAIDQGTSIFNNCLFSGNISDGGWSGGGGAWSFMSNGRYIGCKFLNNETKASSGAGIGCTMMSSKYDLKAINCVFSGNKSAAKGGAIYSSDFAGTGPIAAINCTIVGNTAATGGAAIFADTGSSVTIINNIIANNTATAGAIVEADAVAAGSSMDYNLMNGNTGTATANVTATHAVSGDPKFLSVSDFRLQVSSPAVDAGTKITDVTPLTDIRGATRDAIPDLGAYEFVVAPDIVYVDAAVTASGDGKTWATAKKTINEAVDAAAVSAPGQTTATIWVKAGTYKEQRNWVAASNGINTLVAGGTQASGVVLRKGSKMYGGFAGNEDAVVFDLNTRDFVTNKTIIEGNISSGVYVQHCVVLNDGNVVDGFTVQNGRALLGPGTTRLANRGGGFFADPRECTPDWIGGHVVIKNCIVLNCQAGNTGGGIQLDRMDAEITNVRVENCQSGKTLFTDNNETPGNYINMEGPGGGIAVLTNQQMAYRPGMAGLVGPGLPTADGVIMTSVTVRNCSANAFGGGVAILMAKATMNRCVIQGNTVTFTPGTLGDNGTWRNGFGAGIGMFSNGSFPVDPYATTATAVTMVNCLVSDNTAASYGGGLGVCRIMGLTRKELINCTFANNTAQVGGAIATGANNVPTATTQRDILTSINTIFAKNTSTTTTLPVATIDVFPFQNTATVPEEVNIGSLDYSLFGLNSVAGAAETAATRYTATLVTSTNEKIGDPQFVNAAARDYHLQAISPAIDAATHGGGAPAVDLDLVTRWIPYDIGCYDLFKGGHPTAADTSWVLY